MNADIQIFTSSSNDEAIIKRIIAGLNEANDAPVERHVRPFVVAAKIGDEIVGGAQCATVWDWMHVKLLWVNPSRRGQGLGSRIMQQIEQEAARRNCIGVHVDTYSFQALDFYLKLGYQVFGVIEDHPKGHQRY
ncbi:MAG: GNAT family N-acetyltransferase, partial [Anaerolineales bacterium]